MLLHSLGLVLNFSGNRKKDEILVLEKNFTNTTKIKFVNFVGNYSYKAKNIENIYFASCKVFAVLVRRIQFSWA
jgi:hypothetical protein